MRSFYMRIFKNIICIYVLALCCFAYATMIHAIPDHVYVQEGQKLELDKKIPVTLAMSTKPQSVMAQIGERTFQAMKQERVVETCSQLKQGEYTLTCYLFGILPMKEVQVSVVNGKSLYVSGQVVGIYGAAQGVLVLGSGPVETVDGSSRQPAEHIVFPGDYITAVNGKAVTKKEELMERINQYGEQPVVLTLWRGAEQIQVSVEPVEAAEHKGYRLGLWVKDDMAGIGTLTYFDQDGNFGALGHGIGNGQTKDLLRLSDGRLYKAQVLGIKKGVRGTPGELEGVVYYGKDNQIGEVSSNTQIGIYGTLTKNFREEKKNESLLCPVGYKQEIQTKDAVILSDASGELQSYRIVIDDLDYTPGDKNKGIRFHVEDENLLKLTGGIVQGLSGSPILHAALIARIKIVSGLDISEKRRPQDGRATSIVDRQEYDIRVSVLPTVYGEKVVMRLAQKKALTLDKRDLGFPEDELKKFDHILSHPNGLILVTGPTGSGKSTTLYTALNELNVEGVNIITVEDPVEANLNGVNQVQVNEKAGLTFSSALRSILRQDPDIIMIGEIRDQETAEIAVKASITGHLVVSTLHTNSSANTITRLADMGVENYLIADSVVGVIAQRLVRRVCPACGIVREATAGEKKILGIKDPARRINVRTPGHKECVRCGGTGYYGRIGIYEIMPVTADLRQAINRGENADVLEEIALTHGMKTLRMSAIDYALRGITTVEEVQRVAYDDEED